MGRSLLVAAGMVVASSAVLAQQPLPSGRSITQTATQPPGSTAPPANTGQARPGLSWPTNATPGARPQVQVPQPESPKDAQSTVRIEVPTRFDTGSLRLKYENNGWQLWAGAQMLKDFGRAENEAQQALQVFRDLRVNARGSIGGVFEYWLTDGEAPSAITRNRNVIEFDPARLRAEQMGGNWCLRDDRTILYSFGPSKADAESALAVCQQYGFNQLCYVGHPTPVLKYLMVDHQPRFQRTGAPPQVPASARMQAQEVAKRPLSIPAEGRVGTSQPLDYRRLDLRKDRGEWRLMADKTALADFGVAERDGRIVLQALQQFRCTEICKIGDSGFGFFLSNGRAPLGSLVGISSRAIRLDGLSAKQIEGAWTICQDGRPFLSFGANADDARHALAAIKHYQFDSYCTTGARHLGGVMIFVKSH